MKRLSKDNVNSRKKFFLFIGFVLVSLAVAVLSGYYNFNLINYLQNLVLINHALAAFVYNVLFIVSTSFSFAVTVMIGLGVLFFSKPEMVVYAMIGIMGSSIIDFYISRKLGRSYFRNYLEKRGGKLETFDNIVEKDCFKTIMILSAIYFVPPAIPNFLGGVIKINLKKYSIATFLGNLPNTILTVYLINGLIFANMNYVYFSVAGLIVVSLVALYFYKGEIKDIFYLSFPWMAG